MLQVGSNVIIADNSGAKKALIFRILKSSNARQATIGDTVVVAIKEAAPTSSVKK
jgi:large subunit ribosomal protein L14